jgi:hypothetical protein
MTPRMRVQKCNPQLATQLATQLAICELYVDDTPRFFDTVGRAITVWWPFSFNTVRSVFLGGCLHLALRWRDFCHHKPVFDRSFFDVRVAPDAICVETFDNLVWLRVLSLHRV